jgi:CHASE2 domain-containing sensor protein
VRHPAAGFALVLLASLAIAALELAAPLERKLVDLELKALRSWHPRNAEDVAVVGIDEETLRALGDPAMHLEAFHAALDRGGARAVVFQVPPLAPDADGVVRRPDASSARLIDYSSGPPLDYVPFHRVLEWHALGEQVNLGREFIGRPVLVGRILPGVEEHPAPVQLALWRAQGEPVPGLLIRAQALRGTLEPLPRGLALLAAGLAALCWFFPARWAVALAICAMAVSMGLMAHGRVFPLAAVLLAAALAVAARGARRVLASRLSSRLSSAPSS